MVRASRGPLNADVRLPRQVRILVEVRHFVSILCGVALLWIATRGALTIDGSASVIGSIALFGGLMVLGVGLVMNGFWPRRIVAALCLVIALFLPLGYLNPFAAMDLPYPPPPVGQILSWMGPTVVTLVLLAWLLNPPNAARGAGKARDREAT